MNPKEVFGKIDRLEPRVHGNGFIQCDLCEGRYRLHVWGHPDIPRQRVPTPIHDHVFAFESTVLVGRMVNVVYQPEEDGEGPYQFWVPKVGEDGKVSDSVLVPAPPEDRAHGLRYRMRVVRTEVVLPDQRYRMERFKFHETFVPGPTVTLMEKRGHTLSESPTGPRPYVAVEVGTEPDNGFDRRAHSRDKLLRIIEDVVKLWKD